MTESNAAFSLPFQPAAKQPEKDGVVIGLSSGKALSPNELCLLHQQTLAAPYYAALKLPKNIRRQEQPGRAQTSAHIQQQMSAEPSI